MKIAVYAGSFDPFTNGHLHITKESSALFDKVIVVIAKNANKKRFSDVDKMKNAMNAIFQREGLSNCEAIIFENGLIADFCKNVSASYLIRGLRNTSDYMYEENIAKINQEINPDLKTIYFRADNEIISSSMVRELMTFNKNINKYVPQEIAMLL